MAKKSLFDRLMPQLEAAAFKAAPIIEATPITDDSDTFDPASGTPDPIEWAEFVSGNKLDGWQQDFMCTEESHVLMNCARQVGKSEIVSLRATYRSLYKHRRGVVIAPTLRQSTIIHRRARRWLFNAGIELEEVGFDLYLPGGGQLTALPGDRPDLAIRGDTIDDLIVDEASRVKASLIAAATPATATRTDASIIYLSTPAGRQGAFWEAWSEQDWWHKIKITADQCPRIKEDFLKREKRRLGALYEQEYNCSFLATINALFSSEDLDAVFADTPLEGVTAELVPVEPIWPL